MKSASFGTSMFGSTNICNKSVSNDEEEKKNVIFSGRRIATESSRYLGIMEMLIATSDEIVQLPPWVT